MSKIINLILFFAVFCMFACHFSDDRLTAVNSSKEPMYFSIWDYSLRGREDLKSPFFLIHPGQKREIPLDLNLRYEHIESDSIAIFIVSVKNHDSVRKPNGYHAFEDLLEREDVIIAYIAKTSVIESVEVTLSEDHSIHIR
ncbi:hypothetical protein QWY85_10710 [Neolewinella lacunae]|uniref:Uncharacterized protein n=1 Tax=Neolewinella lacunae TaxID=1517758 RepID=A0A923PFG0_9BACT|nr:hypothetical protein [Neolewinella lacunae]MBC6993158.1 hypothetical protein [Neolewinella lacunae]MDN3635129.1 hypothetical protein [Neolewinella lacunae]